MKTEPIIHYILQTNFSDFIGTGGLIPTKIRYQKDPDFAARWDDLSRATHAADAINNHFRTEGKYDLRVRVVERKVTVEYKAINDFPKM